MTVQEKKVVGESYQPQVVASGESDSLEKRVDSAHIEAFTIFVADYKSRITSYQENPELLMKGLFYANEHFLAMKDSIKIQASRIEDLESELAQVEEQLASDGDHAELVEKKGNLTGLILSAKSVQDATAALFDSLLEGGNYFHGYRNPEFFDPVPNFTSVTGFQPNDFRIKAGKTPSDVVAAYIEGLSLTCCASTILAAKYQALLNLWGEEKFNIIFATDSESPIGFGERTNSIQLFMMRSGAKQKLGGEPNNRSVVKGRNYYMDGIRLYHSKHFNGEAQGFNLLCISDEPGDQRFIGFGLPKDGATEEEVLQILVDEYNREPIGTQIVPEKLKPRFAHEEQVAAKFSDRDITAHDFRKLGGGNLIWVAETFNIDRIQEVINTPVEGVRELVDGWIADEEKNRPSSSSGSGIVLIGPDGQQQECVIC